MAVVILLIISQELVSVMNKEVAVNSKLLSLWTLMMRNNYHDDMVTKTQTGLSIIW